LALKLTNLKSKTLLTTVTSIFFCFSFLFFNAQQNPQYVQYLYNLNSINPAYVRDEAGIISTCLFYSEQKMDIDNSPKTTNAFINYTTHKKFEIIYRNIT